MFFFCIYFAVSLGALGKKIVSFTADVFGRLDMGCISFGFIVVYLPALHPPPPISLFFQLRGGAAPRLA